MKTSATLLPATIFSNARMTRCLNSFFSFIRKIIFLLFLLMLSIFLQAQKSNHGKQRFYKIAISNSHAAKPFGSFSSLFYQDFHPGIDIGYESTFSNINRTQWFYEVRMAYMFHQWVQHNISLYGNLGVRYEVFRTWLAEIKLGGGYQVSIPQSNVFEITESDGVKKKKNFGRSQVIGDFGAAVSKNLSRTSAVHLFLEYKQQIQTPFIREYVPLLPYNSVLIGIKIPFKQSSSKPNQ